jgi:hypothetical protein
LRSGLGRRGSVWIGLSNRLGRRSWLGLRSWLLHGRPPSPGPSRRRSISISRPIIWSPRRTVGRGSYRSGWSIVRWAIVPIATVSRATVIRNRSRAIPDVRRAVRISPSDPNGVIVVAPVRCPIPSPSHPSPRLAHHQNSKRNRGPVTHDHDTGWRSDVNDGWIVDRYINHLRVGRLNYVDRLAGRLLHLHLLLLIALQVPRGVRLVPQSLDRSTHCALIRRKRLPDGGVVVDVLRHHVEHVWEIYQRNKCGIKTLLFCRIGERRALQPLILLQPVRDVQNLLGIR